MWKRQDTQRKHSHIMKGDQRSTTTKSSSKESKITVFIGVWAFVATLLLIIKTFSHGKVSVPESSRSRYAVKQIWHGGSPTDLYKGMNHEIAITRSWLKPYDDAFYLRNLLSMPRVLKVIYLISRFMLLWGR
jgi:hypothetical protein